MKKSAFSAVICQPGGHEQKHDIIYKLFMLTSTIF